MIANRRQDDSQSATRAGSFCEVTAEPLDVAAHLDAVAGAEYGAVASFLGIVRNHDSARQVRALEYSSHPSAGEILTQIVAEARARPGVGEVTVSHRVGPLGIGEIAMVIAVSAAHRGPALSTVQWLVDEVKRRLPIWKQQTFADGCTEWVNCP